MTVPTPSTLLPLLQSGQCVAPGATPPTTRSIELGLFVLVGLFGTGHCLGMCGPLVSLYADRMDGGAAGASAAVGDRDWLTWPVVRQHLLFNLGRVTVYTLLGAGFGLLGSVLFATADATIPFGDAVRAAVGLGVGAAVAAAGLGYLLGGGFLGGALAGGVPLLDAVFRRVYDGLVRHVDDWVGGPHIFGLGFLHGFLPCPLLYPAFLYAFGRADPGAGAAALFALGVGTVPALFLYGTLFQAASLRRRRLVHRLLGAVFLVLGTHTLLAGLRLLGFDVPHLFSLPVYRPLG